MIEGFGGQEEDLFTTPTLLIDVDLMQVLWRCIWELLFGSWLSHQLAQQLVGKLLMAMWDCDVFVLLIVAGIWILKALWTQALLQLCRRCQINFIASDTFLSWISFKGERKEKKRKELRWSPKRSFSCVVREMELRDESSRKRVSIKAIKRNLKFNQSFDSIQYFFRIVLRIDTETWNSKFSFFLLLTSNNRFLTV